MDVAIIGGGAAGFFAAITAKESHPEARVVIYEKTKRPLAKVKISGGGRCNLTNGCTDIAKFSEAYPRGGKALKRAFRVFNNRHAMRWFEARGVSLVVQDDNCVFPESQDSQTIIDCLLAQTAALDIKVNVGIGIKAITALGDRLKLSFIEENTSAKLFDKVIIATGGSPKKAGLDWLANMGHKIASPVPSLFTFNMPDETITTLMGIVVEEALVSIQGTKLRSQGPLLITHWGMSGPAILKLSAFGARVLSEQGYQFKVQVNWVNVQNYDHVIENLRGIVNGNGNKHLANVRPYSLPDRLWRYLLDKCALAADKRWGEVGTKGLNRLVNVLTNDVYCATGKSTFREEFVTCGGVSLESIDMHTMQSKECKNIYFAGEVMDIDGITGGYNFQAAWTTGYIAGQLN